MTERFHLSLFGGALAVPFVFVFGAVLLFACNDNGQSLSSLIGSGLSPKFRSVHLKRVTKLSNTDTTRVVFV